MDHITEKQEKLKYSLNRSKEISSLSGLPVNRVRVLLEEYENCEELIESASEINAEYGWTGFSRVSCGKEKKRQKEIESVLFPKVEKSKPEPRACPECEKDVLGACDDCLPF